MEEEEEEGKKHMSHGVYSACCLAFGAVHLVCLLPGLPALVPPTCVTLCLPVPATLAWGGLSCDDPAGLSGQAEVPCCERGGPKGAPAWRGTKDRNRHGPRKGFRPAWAGAPDPTWLPRGSVEDMYLHR